MIIGLTGSLAAGKGIVANFLKEKGFVYLSLSDELRELLKEKKIQITRENLQMWGSQFREEKGSGYLAELIFTKIMNQQYKLAVVDGIRNPGEIEVLKKLKSFFLISVDAPQEIRFKRIVERNRESDPKTWEDFLIVDGRDKGIGEKETGQGVGRCMNKANYTIINEDLEETKKQIELIYDKIEMDCRPSWDEYFMEISKAVALRATCNRGRSGCVIARDKQLLVTGYVGSPKGLPHCGEVGHQMKKVVHEDGKETMHCMRTTHAEQNAICQAAKLGVSIDKATLYCKMTPCPTCAKMIINSGISRILCEKKYHVGAESEELFKIAGVKIDFLNEDIETYKN